MSSSCCFSVEPASQLSYIDSTHAFCRQPRWTGSHKLICSFKIWDITDKHDLKFVLSHCKILLHDQQQCLQGRINSFEYWKISAGSIICSTFGLILNLCPNETAHAHPVLDIFLGHPWMKEWPLSIEASFDEFYEEAALLTSASSPVICQMCIFIRIWCIIIMVSVRDSNPFKQPVWPYKMRHVIWPLWHNEKICDSLCMYCNPLCNWI